jgi:hypothetical protein
VAGADYGAVSGIVAIPPGTVSRTVSVPVFGDTLDENDETFTIDLSAPVGATIADDQGLGTITDNDPLPFFSTGDCVVTEGNAGSTPCTFTVLLDPVSGRTVTVNYATADGTATAGSDYTAASGIVTFPAGTTQQAVNVGVLGDTVAEADESFDLNLTPGTNANGLDPLGTGTILDDDAAPQSMLEVSHGTDLRADLAGGTPDLYRVSQKALASYEALLDDVSGDAVPGLLLERLAADGVTVAQTALPAGTGSALSLRWENTVAGTVNSQHIRLRSPACGASCGPDDVYRLRVYETTMTVARFNNTGTQVTVLVLHNPTSVPIHGHVSFWSVSGTLLSYGPFTFTPHMTSVANLALITALQGRSGSVTVSHDAPYGVLVGKAVALEPSTGFSFDSPLEPKPR